MTTYTQTKFFFYRTSITFTDYDTICYERKTPYSSLYERIPLVNFSPEANILVKQLSTTAKWFLRLEALIITLFFSAYLSINEFRAVIDLPASVIFFVILAAGSLFYFYTETRTFLTFCDYNQEKIFLRFFYDKENPQQKELMATFDLAVRNARVNHDQRNLTRLQKGIDNLEKQQIISTSFADTLHARVGQLTGKII